MDIYELDSYRLSDAVKFHTELNPALWDGKQMRPEVREALLKIAEDFKTFMGIEDLALEDITVSGSNAAYSYTPHSDIDLHLIVDFSKLNPDEVYQELFNAKKYQYNDTHNIKIRGYDVELYVQDSNNPVRSLGEYSIVNDDWIRIPVQRRANLDEKSTQQKYEKLKKLVELAIASDELDRVQHIADTVKKYRQAGLDKHGEFGPENLAYKILRTQGYIDRLFKHKADLEDSKLSLAERKKKKSKKKKFKYGAFGGVFFPGYHYYGQTDAATDGGDIGGEMESVKEDTTVNVAKKEIPLDKVARRFVHFAAKYLKLQQLPKIKLRKGELSHDIHSMGHYVDDHKTVEVETKDRHVMDILRTLAHELTHYRQHQRLGKKMPDTAGRTGSPYENEANAEAGIIMRHFQNKYPEFFASTVSEDGDDVDAQYGNQEPLGPEFPPQMPAGTTKVDVSDTLDWYKIGMNISDLDDANPEDFGQGPPHTVIVFPSDEFEQPYLKQFKRLGLKTHDIDPPGEEDIDEGLGKAIGTAALAGAMAMGGQAQAQDARTARDIGRIIYQPSGIFTPAGASEEIKGAARDMARALRQGQQPANPFTARSQSQERTSAVANAATVEQAYELALQQALAKAQRQYGTIQGWRVTDHQAQQSGDQVYVNVIVQGPSAVREASGYIPTKKQKNDPRFKTALTVDIKPGQTGREANKLGLNTDAQGHPDLLMKNLQNALKEFKATGTMPALTESQELFEVNMSPSALRSWANSPEAEGIVAGFEAEMIFRDTQNEDGDDDYSESEPDYDYDERATGIEEVLDFFSNDDYGYGLSDRARRRLEAELQDAYAEWTGDQISEEWDNQAEDQVRDYMENNVWEDESEQEDRIRAKVEELFGDDDADNIMAAGESAPRFTKLSDKQEYEKANELYAKYKQAEEEAHDEFETEIVSEIEVQGEFYDRAREFFTEMMMDSGDYDEEEFFRSEHRYMSDVADSYNLEWPYWTQPDRGYTGGRSWDSIAESLHDVVGMEVKVGGGYHSTARKPNRWIMEPDGSLSPDDYTDAGIEIVSPPMPLPKALDKLKAVIEWGNGDGDAYTNESTGLHMGISIPFKGGDVDYVKLILFMGDQYILEKFGRAGNHYCDSAMKKLRQNVIGARNRGELEEAVTTKFNATTALELIKKNLIELAQRYVQGGVGTSKYTSAHIKDGYIEFRSPGGDYLSIGDRGEVDDIENTMLRFARAMYIAGRPDLERREYAKKLTKLLGHGSSDSLKLFSEYAAGTISPEELKKQWADAVLKKELPNTGKEEYEIFDMSKKDSPDGVIDIVYGRDYNDAYDQYLKKHTDNRNTDIRRKMPWWDVVDGQGKIVGYIRSDSDYGAASKAEHDYPDWDHDTWDIVAHPEDGAPEKKLSRRAQVAQRIKDPKVAADNAKDSEQLRARIGSRYNVAWGVWDSASNGFVNRHGRVAPGVPLIGGDTREQALQAARSYGLGHGIESGGLEIRQVPASNVQEPQTTGQFGDPGQQPNNHAGQFTGNWRVLNRNGEEVYMFSGVGNSQSDANRVAQQWLVGQGSRFDDQGPFNVYPVMN